MSDEQIESTLRATFARRAESVADGPTWDADEEPLDVRPPARRSQARWLAPLAAAAVVLAVVSGILVFRSDDRGAPNVSGQVPIPNGMKAVDALGVEIFVPKSMKVDSGPCGFDVERPIAEPQTWYAAKCLVVAQVTIRPAAGAMHPGLGFGCSGTTVSLAGESECLFQHISSGHEPIVQTITWPAHAVAITTRTPDAALGLQIINSAHVVPIDRNGCSAENKSLAPSASTTSIHNIPDRVGSEFYSGLLPVEPTRSMSVCWYIGNRLVASALLDQSAARTVVRIANGMPPMWPALLPRPNLPSCQTMAERDGVLLTAHAPGHPDVTAVADFAACNGQRTSRSATAAYLTTSGLAIALAKATGIPISLDYPATR
jgi:hypothetical protein